MYPVITLTSDFGQRGFYIAKLKGIILSNLKDSQRKIVDISNDISPFNIEEAAYIVKHSYKYFPKGSIHILAIDMERTPHTKHVIIRCNDHYFIAADNGVLSLILDEKDSLELFEIPEVKGGEQRMSEIFAKIASLIANGDAVENMCLSLENILELKVVAPVVQDSTIKGTFIYIDSYGNGVSNIKKTQFEKIKANYEIYSVKVSEMIIEHIYDSYSSFIDFSESSSNREVGREVALFNSEGLLEIIVYKGNEDTGGSAKTLLGIDYGVHIYINFA